MTKQTEALQLATKMDLLLGWDCTKEAAAELRRLHEVISKVSLIAHCGGLNDMTQDDALHVIRGLTVDYWDKSLTREQMRSALAKATGKQSIPRKKVKLSNEMQQIMDDTWEPDLNG